MTTFAILSVLLIASYFYVNSKPKSASRSQESTFKDWFKGNQTQVRTIDKGRMTRCHNCGCFFPESRVVTKVIEGHVLEFCTTNCRQNFRYT